MFLSRVFLAPGRLHNPYEWHRIIWTLFPNVDRKSDESAPFLFRIERLNLRNGAQTLVQSNIKPYETGTEARVFAVKEFVPKLKEGQRMRFYLRANPTKKINDEKKMDRKIRVPLIREDEQMSWLGRKFSAFSRLDKNKTDKDASILVRTDPPIYFSKNPKMKMARYAGKIVPVTYEGTMTITNFDNLFEAMKRGIGPAKAFGCGLLSIARV